MPSLGDHVAWAESSALSFVNSYIGARTNREGGPGALAAAILGKTANYGLHLDEHRKPTVVIDVEDMGSSVFDYSLLGQAVGMKMGRGVPYFRGIDPTVEDAKTLSAAMAAAGSVALWHAEGCTPEAGGFDVSGLEHITIGKKERQEAYEKLNTVDDVQLIAIGCPHLTPKEMHDIAAMLKGKEKRNKDVEIWFCTSESVRAQCPDDVKEMERFGPVLADTCMVVAPIEGTFQRTATNSAKAGNYLPTLCSQKVKFAELSDLLKVIE